MYIYIYIYITRPKYSATQKYFKSNFKNNFPG